MRIDEKFKKTVDKQSVVWYSIQASQMNIDYWNSDMEKYSRG